MFNLAGLHGIYPDSVEDKKVLYEYACKLIDADIAALKSGGLRWNKFVGDDTVPIDPCESILELENKKIRFKKELDV